MPGSQKSLINVSIVFSMLLLSGCVAPLIIGGAAVGGAMATREKGIGETMSDSNICSKVKNTLYNFNADLHAKVSVSVQNQEVLLTGVVQDSSWPAEAERLAKGVEGVKSVINNIETEGEETLGSMTSDSWITTRVRSSLLFADDLYSLNYKVETSNGIVYLTGIGQDEAEINRAVEIARNIGGVRKVVNYVKTKGQEGTTQDSTESTDSSPQENTIVATELQPIDGPISQESTQPDADAEDRG